MVKGSTSLTGKGCFPLCKGINPVENLSFFTVWFDCFRILFDKLSHPRGMKVEKNVEETKQFWTHISGGQKFLGCVIGKKFVLYGKAHTTKILISFKLNTMSSKYK